MTAFFKEIEPFRGNGNENEKGQTLEEFLEEYDPYKYKNPCVTTDAVIFSCKRKVVDGEWKVLMVKGGIIRALVGGRCRVGLLNFMRIWKIRQEEN